MERGHRSLKRISRSASAPLLPDVTIPALHSRTHSLQGARPGWPPPRRRGTTQLAALLIILLVLHLVSSFVARKPQPEVVLTQFWSQQQLDGDGLAQGDLEWPFGNTSFGQHQPQQASKSNGTTVHRRIPRIIHYVYNGSSSGHELKTGYWFKAWQAANPGWELWFRDWNDCESSVQRWFPEYLEVYQSLGTDVERLDFFRYLTVLKHGGFFAGDHGQNPSSTGTIDAVVALDEILRSEDSFVAGWDVEYSTPEAALDECSVRAKPLQHYFFAAVPQHPLLKDICDRIVSTLNTQFSLHPVLDVMERTGPGVFTDLVLGYAARHSFTERIKILPRRALGIPKPRSSCSTFPSVVSSTDNPSLVPSKHVVAGEVEGNEGLNSGAAFDLFHKLGEWRHHVGSTVGSKAQSASGSTRSASDTGRPDVSVATHLDKLAAKQEKLQLFPVSASFEPSFDIMTHLVSHGERQSGWDVSLALSTYGTWQPSVQPDRRPSLSEALVGSLGRGFSGFNASMDASIDLQAEGGVLVDVGAGYGFLSLAAASRGHRVHAFELGPGSVAALEASIERNSFGHLVTIHKVPLGAAQHRGPACLEFQPGLALSDAMNQHTANVMLAKMEIAQGYSHPDVHATTLNCARSAIRIVGSEALPPGEQVDALRISANGWEGFVLEGFLPTIRQHRPPVISVEWNPTALQTVGYATPLNILRTLTNLGYTDVSHSGFICDERWYALTYGIRRRGGKRPEDREGMRQPTWCRLTLEDYAVLLEKANSKYPETLLFINKESGAARFPSSKANRGIGPLNVSRGGDRVNEGTLGTEGSSKQSINMNTIAEMNSAPVDGTLMTEEVSLADGDEADSTRVEALARSN